MALSADGGVPLGALTREHTGAHPITICRRADSETNPYVRVTVELSDAGWGCVSLTVRSLRRHDDDDSARNVRTRVSPRR